MIARELVRILECEIEVIVRKKHKLAEILSDYQKKKDRKGIKATEPMMDEITGREHEAGWMLDRIWKIIDEHLSMS